MKAEPMTPPNPTVDRAYRNFAELLLQRHRLLLQGKGESPEVEDVEDDLSALWENLDDAQRQSLNGIAADLNWQRRRGSPAPKGRRREDVTDEDRRLLADAESKKDWHAALHYLRVCSPVLTIDEISRRRAAAYAGLALPGFEDVYRGLPPAPGENSDALRDYQPR